jgi:flagellar hook-basal body complex protein FliE
MIALEGIASAVAAAPALLNDGGALAASSGTTPFAGVLQSMTQEMGALNQKASDAVEGVLRGQGVDVHDALIATQKASMAFELALQVRSKAVAAYQQMMGMQF